MVPVLLVPKYRKIQVKQLYNVVVNFCWLLKAFALADGQMLRASGRRRCITREFDSPMQVKTQFDPISGS